MAKENNKTYFIVGIETPDGMKKNRIREYIKQAITCERGNHLPEDDFYDIDTNSLTILNMSDNAFKHFFGGQAK